MDGTGAGCRARLPIAYGYQRGVTALRGRCARATRRHRVVTAYAFSERTEPAGRAGGSADESVRARGAQRTSRAGQRRRSDSPLRPKRAPAARDARGFEDLVAQTAANDGLTLNLAIDYGGRREIGDAVRALACEVSAGLRKAETIDERDIQSRLYTAGLPDPDLVIRTGGETRISTFCSFSRRTRILATDTHWPDFGEAHLRAAWTRSR